MADLPVVAFALTGDVRMNSRAVKQFRVLQEIGFRIEAFTLGGEDHGHLLGENVRLHVLPTPETKGLRFFRQVHQIFSRAVQVVRADVYHASDLYVLPALAKAAKRHQGKLVFDSRELYPYVAATAGRPWISMFWHAVSGHYLPKADAVFTVSESIADRLSALYGIENPPVLYNVPDFLGSVTPSGDLRKQAQIPHDRAVILHQGNMQRSRGCDLLIEAMQDVERAVLVFLGNGTLRHQLEGKVEKLALHDKVRFLPPVPPDELLPVTAGADFGVTLLEDTCLNHRFALPNKLFEYLITGLPVLASDLPEIRRVVEDFNVGKVVNPTDRMALATALQHMTDDRSARDMWRANAPRVLKAYTWASGARQFAEIYRGLIEKGN